jgi:hypothetical protein
MAARVLYFIGEVGSRAQDKRKGRIDEKFIFEE